MKISACYIVKDEAKVLARSLESVRESVEEIVVVDTGSTDGSQKIARQYGARVIQSAWQDDFALARNKAIEQACGDWIVFLDADEYFDVGRKNIRSLLQEHQQDDVDVFLIRMHNIDEESGALLVDFFAPRIFRNRPELRYAGRIHEQLLESGQTVQRIAFLPENQLSIIHTGYSASMSRQKAERNLHLLLHELQQTEQPERLYGYLAEAYDGLGDVQKACEYAYKDIARGRQNLTYASHSYRILLKLLSEDSSRFVERRQAAAAAVRDFPELPEFHAEHAECLAYVFQYEEALAEMKQAVSAQRNYQGLEPMMFPETAVQLCQERMELWQHIQQQMKNIRISSCIIVKNEEKNMAGWLAKAKVYSDEIILVDTGSTDRTREIVQQQGIQVRNFVWDHNFSHAKNFALEQADGDWIVFLDADETFCQAEWVRPFLAEMTVLRPDREVVFNMISNVDSDCQDRENQHFLNVRMFRNLPELRYQGRIHEELKRTDGRELRTFQESERLKIWHTGYSSGLMQAKLHRNLELLQEDIAEQGGETPAHYRYLASSYFALGDFARALHYIELHLASPYEILYSESDMYYLAVSCLENMDGREADAYEYIEKGIVRFPDLPDFYALRGLRWYKRGAVMAAVPDLQQALKNIGRSREASRIDNLLPGIYTALAAAAWQQQADAEAVQYAKDAIHRKNCTFEDFMSAFGVLSNGMAQDKKKLLEYFQQSSAEDEVLLRLYLQRMENMGEIALYQELLSYASQRFSVQPDDEMVLYDQVQQHHKNEVYQKVMERLPDVIKKVFWAEISMDAVQQEAELHMGDSGLDLLPEGMRQCILRYRGQIECLAEEYRDSYELFLPDLIMMHKPDVLHRYLEIVFDFSWTAVAAAARKLLDAFMVEEAAALYGKIPEQALLDAEFYRDQGICFYLTGKHEKAKKCLQEALRQGYQENDVHSYLQWIEDEENA